MAHESQSENSILDFIYVDREKLKSWVAQLDDNGPLLGHTQTSQSTESGGNEVSGGVEATGAASVLLAKGSVKSGARGKLSSAQSASLTHQKQFDATWALPLNALDLLSDTIERDIEQARVGSLVLVSGAPQLVDIKLLQQIWQPATNQILSAEKVTHKNKAEKDRQKGHYTDLGAIARALPPSPQMSVLDSMGRTIWANLKEEHLLINASAIALTYGVNIKDLWHVVGILDAQPDDGEVEAQTALKTTDLMQASGGMLQSMRELMGRNPEAYGITPVIIYRKVGAL